VASRFRNAGEGRDHKNRHRSAPTPRTSDTIDQMCRGCKDSAGQSLIYFALLSSVPIPLAPRVDDLVTSRTMSGSGMLARVAIVSTIAVAAVLAVAKPAARAQVVSRNLYFPTLTVSIISPADGGAAPGQTIEAGVFSINNSSPALDFVRSARRRCAAMDGVRDTRPRDGRTTRQHAPSYMASRGTDDPVGLGRAWLRRRFERARPLVNADGDCPLHGPCNRLQWSCQPYHFSAIDRHGVAVELRNDHWTLRARPVLENVFAS